MRDQPIDSAPRSSGAFASGADIPRNVGNAPDERSRRERRRSDWRQGDRSALAWDLIVLSGALLGWGGGQLAALTFDRLDAPWAAEASSVALWAGLGTAVLFAFTRSRPAGLLRVRPTDFLWGLGLGIALRLMQGVLGGAQHSPFPSVSTLDGTTSVGGLGFVLLSASVIAPAVEETFFRGLVLVLVFGLLRPKVGAVAAGAAAVLVSAGSFVLVHLSFAPVDASAAWVLLAVGVTCAVVVLSTGRIAGAVLIHIVYNVSYLALVGVGTVMS